MAFLEGFDNADFDAFAERKWESNAFNLQRLQVKLKLNALGKAVMAELGDELDDQEMGLTEERPSIFNQHKVRDLTLFFFRDQQARKVLGAILDKARSIADNVLDPAPHHKHIVLGVRINMAGLQSGLWLHKDAWVDWKNAVERCRGYGESERLNGILSSLPEDVRYGRGRTLDVDAPPALEVGWKTLIEGFEKADPWTMIGESIERSDPVLAEGDLVAWVVGLFRALMPLNVFIGWTRENDFHGLKAIIKEHREKVQRQFSSLQEGDKVRIVKGLASGRVGVVESIEKRGKVKVRLGLLVMSVKMEDLARP